MTRSLQTGRAAMACPFFMPLERFGDGAWSHPARLPLGSGWRGICTSPMAVSPPDDHMIQERCNLGYALECPNLPVAREFDAVRFSVSKCLNGVVTLSFVCERDHRPIQHGTIDFSRVDQRWISGHADPRIQKMAECYLDSYLRKNNSAEPQASAG